MKTNSELANTSDAAMAAEASDSDQEAFAALYERYFQGIYDFALRMVSDTQAAGDVVQNTFLKAWQQLRSTPTPENFKAWLFTVARNAAIDEIRRRKRLVAMDEGELAVAFAEIDAGRMPDPQEAVEDQELIELVWSAASALRPEEYALLDLHLRQGLSVEELAENLNLRRGSVYTRLSRLRNSLEESVVAQLLRRHGRQDCAELEELLAVFLEAELTHGERQAIQMHLQHCEICQESKRRYASPAEIFAALAPIPAAPGLQDMIWQKLAAQIQTIPVARDPSTETGGQASRAWLRTMLASRKMLFGALFALAAVIIAGALMLAGDGRGATASDPADIRSISHDIGKASSVNVVVLIWSFQPDAQAYSILWNLVPSDQPDTTPELPGKAIETSSSPLGEGAWYFHLRTQGKDGRWTSTVHVGPFIIVGPQATHVPVSPTTLVKTPSRTPTATRSSTPTQKVKPTQSEHDGQ